MKFNDNSLSTLDNAEVTLWLVEIMVAIKYVGGSLTILLMLFLHVWPGCSRIRNQLGYMKNLNHVSQWLKEIQSMMQRFQSASKPTSKRAFVGFWSIWILTYESKCRSEPLLWWWNKYTAYHRLTLATTPSQKIAKLQHNPAGVVAGGALPIFHRTLRVPEVGVAIFLPYVALCAFELQLRYMTI